MTPQPIRLVLTRPHTHAGQDFKAGDRIDVPPSTAEWLIANGIARRDRDVAPPRTDPEPKSIPRKEPKP